MYLILECCVRLLHVIYYTTYVPYCLSKFKKNLNSKVPSGVLELSCLKHEGLCKFSSRHQTTCCHSWKRQDNCNKNNTSFIVLFLETLCWNCPSIIVFPSFLGNKRRSWWMQAARSTGWYIFSGEEKLALQMIHPNSSDASIYGAQVVPQRTGEKLDGHMDTCFTKSSCFSLTWKAIVTVAPRRE